MLLLGLAVSTGVSLPLLHDASRRGHGEGQSRGALGEFLAFRGSGLGEMTRQQNGGKVVAATFFWGV